MIILFEKQVVNEEVMQWFVTFFNGKRSATTSSVYNNAAESGSGRKEAVRKRTEEVTTSYEKYFTSIYTQRR